MSKNKTGRYARVWGLRSLDLSWNDLREGGGAALVGSLYGCRHKLHVLCLSFCGLPDKVGSEIFELAAKAPHLEELVMDNNHFSRGAAAAMAELLRGGKVPLRKVLLGFNPLGLDAAVAVVQSQCF